MPGRSFITSRKGNLSDLFIYRYKFIDGITLEKKKKLCAWLNCNNENLLLEIKSSYFLTLKPLENKKTAQYCLESSECIQAPFLNTPYISTILSKIINKHYAKLYKQYLNKNIFVLNSIALSPFVLHKCFEYNLEIFNDGSFFVHFFPTSKIVSQDDFDENYLKNLSAGFKPVSNEDMRFNVINKKTYKRIKVDLRDKDIFKQIASIFDSRHTALATFDYHFLANYEVETFLEITKYTERLLSFVLKDLQKVSEELISLDCINWHSKPFYEINITPLLLRNNLLIGNNVKANQQSAAFYEGMYHPVDDMIIQPVVVDNLDILNFKVLVNQHFNKNGTAEIYDEIRIKSGQDIELSQVLELKRKFGHNIIFPIFTRYQLPKDFLSPMLKLNIKYQIYCGETGKPYLHQLSNFTVKCLEKAGGVLSVINNLYEPETSYFIGFDMGHTTHNSDNYTNLCMVLFDNKGCFIKHWLVNKIPKNEALSFAALNQCFELMKKYFLSKKLPPPEKLIIHRDGKIHKGDIEALLLQAKNHFQITNLDILEVIKSGYPIVANFGDNAYRNLNSGEYWVYEDKKYAILVTNIQADKKGEVLNPIIIKQKHGSTIFTNLVEQLYWFTKIYTNNLYNSTRLPATTEKANNLVGTGNRQHISTYLA